MDIRPFCDKDLFQILEVYRKAFGGFPWYEELSSQEILGRWNFQSTRPGFTCFIADLDGKIVGGIWWDRPTKESLLDERGELLVSFIKGSHSDKDLVWERELLVDPLHSRKGIATRLRMHFVEDVKRTLPCEQIVLTRMRDDNIPILRIADKIGYQRTGIKMPCSIKPEVQHEYWFLLV